MHQAIPYRTWNQTPTRHPTTKNPTDAKKLAMETPVIVFGRRGCCMSHVMKRLLLGIGVSPAVYEVDEAEESELIRQLMSVSSVVDLNQKSVNSGDEMIMTTTLPIVFVGGRLFGGLDRVMATHISGDLVPALKRAGALWL